MKNKSIWSFLPVTVLAHITAEPYHLACLQLADNRGLKSSQVKV